MAAYVFYFFILSKGLMTVSLSLATFCRPNTYFAFSSSVSRVHPPKEGL